MQLTDDHNDSDDGGEEVVMARLLLMLMMRLTGYGRKNKTMRSLIIFRFQIHIAVR